jgi:hypothetical protein
MAIGKADAVRKGLGAWSASMRIGAEGQPASAADALNLLQSDLKGRWQRAGRCIERYKLGKH